MHSFLRALLPSSLLLYPSAGFRDVRGNSGLNGSEVAEHTSKYVPTFVMLPLTTITSDGLDVSSDIPGMFDKLADSGIDGFMVDVWWGLTEPRPKEYVWDGYKKLFKMAKDRNWKVQIVSSFHQCGGNVGDDCFIPIPSWIPRDEGIWYKDQHNNENKEYISLFADNVKIQPDTKCGVEDSEKAECGFYGIDEAGCEARGCCWSESSNQGTPWCYNSVAGGSQSGARTPVQMYADWFAAFEATFQNELESLIVEVMVGLGPAGELRYPAYPLAHWNYCGIGEFQSHDQHALQSLASAAKKLGKQFPWDKPFAKFETGDYNSQPPSNTQFFGSLYKKNRGRFFIDWYFNSLRGHGKSVLSAAKRVFGRYNGVKLAAKIAGIHWWYGDSSHAAEVTAGYYNTNGKNGYEEIADTFKDSGGVTFLFTCLEMSNFEQSASCKSTPENLVEQTAEAARTIGIPYAGENALPRYDRTAYEKILSRKADLTAFTYLRLNQRLLNGQDYNEFKRFVRDMHQ